MFAIIRRTSSLFCRARAIALAGVIGMLALSLGGDVTPNEKTDAAAADKPKRNNPKVVAIPTDDGSVQFDYWQAAPIRVYAIDRAKEEAMVVGFRGNLKKRELAENVVARPLLVVSAFFPLKEQVQQFRRALGSGIDDDLGKDHPQILGLNVKRVEMTVKVNDMTGDKEWVPVPDSEVQLYTSRKDLVRAAPHVADLLRQVRIDDEALNALGNHRQPNLMTLMPMLAGTAYQPLKLNNFKPLAKMENTPKSILPVRIVPPQRNEVLERVPWNELADPEVDPVNAARMGPIVLRLRGKYPIFDGQNAAGGGKDAAKPAREVETQSDALIRFFDVDIEPGRTYQYQMAVRLANPNFKRVDLIRPADALEAELPMEWASTRPFTVPAKADDILIYALDRWQPWKKVEMKFVAPYPCGPDATVLDDKTNRAAVQIHRWFGEAKSGEDRFVVVDWVVAERVLVRRGEYVGRKNLPIPVPTWNVLKRDFEVLNPPVLPAEAKDKNKDKKAAPSGIPLDFSGSHALLVDFSGGPKGSRANSFSAKAQVEESAMDLLLMNPDGKLIVRNSRRDFALEARALREREYRDRLNHFMLEPNERPANIVPAKKKALE